MCSRSIIPSFHHSIVPSSLRHRLEEFRVRLRALEPLEQELDRLHRRHIGQEVAQQVALIQLFLAEQQLFLAGAGALDVDRREGAALGDAAVEDHFGVTGALNSSKMTSSMREPVSISAVARIVSEPPPSMLRAAPKKRLGFCSAFASTPPDRILPECGTTTLWARPRRVIESSRMTTSLPCSTRRLAFSI